MDIERAQKAQVTSINLDLDVLAILDALAKKTDKSRSAIVNEVLRATLRAVKVT